MNKQRIILGLLCLIVLGVLISLVFPGKVILPQIFHILSWPIRIYGLILGLSVLAGYELARRRSGRFKIPQDQLDNIAIVLIITGLIGARLYHVFSSLEYYAANPIAIAFIWHGGLSIFGAVLGGAVGLWLYQKYSSLKQAFLIILDWLAPSLVLGQILGRLGNLFNYEAYGLPTMLPWKMFVPVEFRLTPYQSAEFFHPLFLYESLGCLLILLILLNFSKLTKRYQWLNFPGAQILVWLLLYGVLRLGTESLRLDSPYLFGMKQNLLVAGLMVVVAIVVLWFKKLFYKSNESQSS